MNPTGLIAGPETQVTNYSAGHGIITGAAALADGGWAFIWRSDGPTPESQGSFVRSYAAA